MATQSKVERKAEEARRTVKLSTEHVRDRDAGSCDWLPRTAIFKRNGVAFATRDPSLEKRWDALLAQGADAEEMLVVLLLNDMIVYDMTAREFVPTSKFRASLHKETDASTEQPAQTVVAGRKDDSGKILAGVLYEDFPHALQCVAEVASFGARKYARSNWLKVPNAQERYWDALHRHLLEHCKEPQNHDPESNLPHLAHAAWNALATLELYLKTNYVGNPK